jgi:hypothetical protein
MHVTEAQINQSVVMLQCAAGAVLVFRHGLLDRDDLSTLERLLRHAHVTPEDDGEVPDGPGG